MAAVPARLAPHDKRRDDLFDLLEELDWAPVQRTLASAVAAADPALLPGEALFTPPPLPIAPPRHSHEPRTSWAIRVAYFGPAFRGFAWQADYDPRETVSGCLDHALTPLLGRRPRQNCAGRTDAGVSALGQLVSFHSFPELTVGMIREAIDTSAPEPSSLRMVSAQQVPRSFHATFSTTWRRYVYLLPARGLGVTSEALHRQLEPLVGEPLDYAALGRGVPRGKDTRCTLLAASASAVHLPEEAIRIDLVGDRFLRRMVRTLVASAVWAARRDAEGMGEQQAGDDGVLLLRRMATSGDQHETAHPAPPLGLCFAGRGGEGDVWN